MRLFFALVLVALASPALAAERFAQTGEITRPPVGWYGFCAAHKEECDTKPSMPRDAAMTSQAWADLVQVNDWVNNNIQPLSDLEHWGIREQWDYAEDGYGDCEDYVLLKRKLLLQAGWPREVLLITVVIDPKSGGHAVLTVRSDLGDLVLDNQDSAIKIWHKTRYRFIKRQSQADPNVWVTLVHDPPVVGSLNRNKF